MKKIFITVGLIGAINLLLLSCANTSTLADRNKSSIEDLADGNYRYCSDPNPYPDKIDVHIFELRLQHPIILLPDNTNIVDNFINILSAKHYI